MQADDKLRIGADHVHINIGSVFDGDTVFFSSGARATAESESRYFDFDVFAMTFVSVVMDGVISRRKIDSFWTFVRARDATTCVRSVVARRKGQRELYFFLN